MKDRWSFNYGESRIIILSKEKLNLMKTLPGNTFLLLPPMTDSTY